MPPRIREMNWRTDREAVLSFQTEVYELNFPGFRMSQAFLRDYERQLRQALRQPNERILVLDNEGQVVGFLWASLVSTMVEPCVGYIKNVFVVPAWRGLGYGKQLLRAADEWFKQNHCRRAALDATISNRQAVAVYEAAGYVPARYRMEKVYEEEAARESEVGEHR